MSNDTLETYLRTLRASHTLGTKETTGYGPLANLLNTIGGTLTPTVHCLLHPRSQGAGIPDGGLFSYDQLPSDEDPSDNDLLAKQTLPSRGVLEVKDAGSDVYQVAESEQVQRYFAHYGQVLVTNYRDFLLLLPNPHGQACTQESYRLAESEQAFWTTPIPELVATHAEGLEEYLKRVMLSPIPIKTPQDLAWFIASYAREARRRVARSDIPALAQTRMALEQSLGITFQGKEGDTFFRSTLVQTLFYGLFAAWVLWHNEQPSRTDEFRWREAGYYLHVPILQALFSQVSLPGRLRELHLIEVLDWTGAALNRVDREAFFAIFDTGQAVQYFYEPFLERFDPQLRKQLGVWYTPPEIVQYMVARVDMVLRTDLGIAEGLAHPDVYVLDPCCGTGAYLVEVVRHIAETLRQRGEEAMLGELVKRAVQTRIFGFELLPAPFVIAHLQVGIVLQNLGVVLGQEERAGVYLTNALSGWFAADPEKERIIQHTLSGLPELQEERDAAKQVKQDTPILVILGNPPYNAYAGVSPEEEEGLVEPYKVGLISQWGIKKFNLDDLYIRFFRLAERRIAEMSGKGIVCYISNYSWVSEPSFVVVRQKLLQSFDRFWVENMHGNRKISEYAPDGRSSETIFAIRGFSPGIQQGVVLSLWMKNGMQHDPQVLYRNDLNAAKAEERRQDLLASLQAPDFDAQYTSVYPTETTRYAFRPSNIPTRYHEWVRLIDLCAESPSYGLMEKRGGALLDIDRERLEYRIKRYYDSTVSWEELERMGMGLTRNAARFDAKKTRAKLLAAETYQSDHLVRYALRPFDTRWCYYSSVRSLWNECRPTLWSQCWEGNRFLLTRFNAAKSPEGPPISYTHHLSDDHYLAPDAVAIPLQLRSTPATPLQTAGQPDHAIITANLSPLAREYLASLGITDPDTDADTAALLWMHALAIGYSPRYLSDNADGIRQDWLRIPLPQDREVLLHSASLGRQVAALLDTEQPVTGVTTGTIRPELRTIGTVAKVGGGSINATAGDLELRAGWGYAGRSGVTMPGKGRVEYRPYTAEEQALLGDAGVVLGEKTCDLYLNEVAYWRNIPLRVWEYTIGGYQVIKKWLSYREHAIIQRALSPEEVQAVRDIARRLAALVLLEQQLDASYAAAT